MTSVSTWIGIAIGAAVGVLYLLRSRWNSRRAPAELPGPSEMTPPDEESMDHLRTNARYLVWAGFHDREQIIEILSEVVTENVDESVTAPLVDAELASKREAEKTWPGETDCDRLSAAFDTLHKRGIFAMQYAGYTQSDGREDVAEALAHEDATEYFGYCFFTAQDVERLLDDGRSLLLAFGANSEDGARTVEAGRVICDTLQIAGFQTKWEENPETRIEVTSFDWKKRSL